MSRKESQLWESRRAPKKSEVANGAPCYTTCRDGEVRIRTGSGVRWDWGKDGSMDPIAWAYPRGEMPAPDQEALRAIKSDEEDCSASIVRQMEESPIKPFVSPYSSPPHWSRTNQRPPTDADSDEIGLIAVRKQNGGLALRRVHVVAASPDENPEWIACQFLLAACRGDGSDV